ncbi:hypothetical protein [Psychroserpens ponticola]|uniref:Uncharacterized protein n=1 Tax=Psychroserpens ponticola TaxID=2932268 RepID=A0ABY7S246_9FLAO|nr:hypothetical protein [Psychroserpens ponticola]WCO03348.1 hypothetical protein MUN68_007550 [Psychroserpens ponticola]
MTIVDSNVGSQILKQEQSEAGTLHFFNHIAVVEFYEGLHVDLNSGRQTINDLMNYFGTTKPFGLIANRVNSYSISLLDTTEVKSIFPNMVAYGVVSHNEAGRMNAIIESSFCSSNGISFDNLYEGLDAVYLRVINKLNTYLN